MFIVGDQPQEGGDVDHHLQVDNEEEINPEDENDGS